MKFILIATLALASLSSFANMDKKHEEMMKKMDSMSFEDAKKWKMDMLSQKKSMINEEESCISSSKDKAGLKQCSDQMHSKMDSMMKDAKKKM
jgi:hypothetical protein